MDMDLASGKGLNKFGWKMTMEVSHDLLDEDAEARYFGHLI